MVKLSMPTLLPLVWAAYMAKELQAQTPGGKPDDTCRYDGPCAIGVGIPETQRARFDRSDAAAIDFLIRDGKIRIQDEESISDYSKLQTAHDGWTYKRHLGDEAAKNAEEEFVTHLKLLSQKYGVEIPDGAPTVQP